MGSYDQDLNMGQQVLTGFFLLLASVSGMYRGLGDKYVVRMDELVQPFDRHIKHIEKPVSSIRRLVRRKVRRPSSSQKFKRSADGEQNKFVDDFPEFRSGGVQILTKHSIGDCGTQKIHFEPPLYSTRIRNGTCTPYGAFPWTVQIQRKNGHHCGGSLISDQHILTARHCFEGVQALDLKVVVGQYDMNGVDDKEMEFNIERIWLHKDFQ